MNANLAQEQVIRASMFPLGTCAKLVEQKQDFEDERNEQVVMIVARLHENLLAVSHAQPAQQMAAKQFGLMLRHLVGLALYNCKQRRKQYVSTTRQYETPSRVFFIIGSLTRGDATARSSTALPWSIWCVI